MRKDLYNHIKVLKAFNSQTISSDTTTNGNIIDTKGYDALVFVFSLGTRTAGTFTPLIEEGDHANLDDNAAVADANLFNTEALAALAATNGIAKIGYRVGNKRYVRFSVVSSSIGGGCLGVSCDAILANADLEPVA